MPPQNPPNKTEIPSEIELESKPQYMNAISHSLSNITEKILHGHQTPVKKLAKVDVSQIEDITAPTAETSTENPDGISTGMAFFLNFRSLIGIGILAFPHTVQEAGWLLVILTFPLIVTALIYGLDLIIKTADATGYYGSSLEELVEKVLGPVHKTFTTITNWLICFSTCVASVILAIQFVEFSACQLGLCFANSRLWLNLGGFFLCIPTIFISKIDNFKYLATGALAVILVSVLSILGYELSYVGANGIHENATTTNAFRFPEYFGVMCFAIEGVGTIMPIRNSMKHRKQFRPMFLWTLIGICSLLLAFGIFGC